MYGKIKEHLQHELAEIEAAGLYKRERITLGHCILGSGQIFLH